MWTWLMQIIKNGSFSNSVDADETPKRRLIRVCAMCHVKRSLANGG